MPSRVPLDRRVDGLAPLLRVFGPPFVGFGLQILLAPRLVGVPPDVEAPFADPSMTMRAFGRAAHLAARPLAVPRLHALTLTFPRRRDFWTAKKYSVENFPRKFPGKGVLSAFLTVLSYEPGDSHMDSLGTLRLLETSAVDPGKSRVLIDLRKPRCFSQPNRLAGVLL